MTPKIAYSAVSGDPTAVTSITKHSIFIKFTQVKLSGLKRGFLHHKVAPRPQSPPELSKTMPSKTHPQNSTFRSVRGSASCYIGYQPLYYDLALSKVIRGQEGVPTSTRAEQTIKSCADTRMVQKVCAN